MPLDDFLKSGSRTKKQTASHAQTDTGETVPDEITPYAESDPMPDRLKIALLRRLLEEKNLSQKPAQQRLAVSRNGKADSSIVPAEDFITAFERFAEWIRGRVYLRGDIETAKQMIANLVLLDRSLMPPSEGGKDVQRFADIADFLKAAKQHDSLHPNNPLLTKQEIAALMKRKQGKPLTSTDYRHLKILKERVREAIKIAPFHDFLASYLDVPEF